MIISTCAPNDRPSTKHEAKSDGNKETDDSTIIVGDLHTPLSKVEQLDGTSTRIQKTSTTL